MKLHLPKFLLMALLAVQTLPFSNAAEAHISAGIYHYESNQLVLTSDITMPAEHGISWSPTADSAELTGNATISCEDGSWYFSVGYPEQETKVTYVVGEDITLKNADVSIYATEDSKLEINGTLDACKIDAYQGIIDLTHTTIRGNTDYEIECGGTIVKANVEVKPNNYLLTSSGDSSVTTDCANLEGNLVMNGVAPSFTTEQVFDYYPDGFVNPSLRPYGLLVYWTAEDEDSFTPLNVKGSVTILSETGVLFANEGAWEHRTEGDTTITTWSSDYRTPTNDEAVLICTGVDADSLSLLKPFAWREDTWSEYGSGDDATDGGNEYVKPLSDREFYAKAGDDGKVYIYLGEKLDYVVLNDWTSGADIRDKHIVVNGNCSFSAASCLRWIGTGDGTNYEMTGSGAISADEGWYLQIFTETVAPVAFSIARDITLENALVGFNANSASSLQINGTLKDSNVHVWSGKVDVSNATMSGRNFFQISRGATLVDSNFEVKENVALRNYDGYPVSDLAAYTTLEGNLVMNGSLPGIEAETQTKYDHGGWTPALHSSGYVQFGMDYDEFAPLNVTGAISIKSDTAIVFSNEGEYRLPGTDDAVFICSSVDQDSLSMLQAYAHRREYRDYAYTAYTKLVTDREFYAQTGSDGKVYIYLGDATGDSGEDAPSVPSVPVTGSVVLNDLTLADADDYGSFAIRGRNIELKGNWTPPYSREDGELVSIDWISEDASTSHTLSGSGTLGCNGSIVELDICGPGQFTIAKDITIANSEISLDESETGGKDTVLSVEGTLHNANVYVGRGVLKMDNATLSGYQFYELEPGSVVQRAELNLSAKRSGLSVYDYDWANTNATPKIVGNLVLDGQGSYFGNTEKSWTGESEDLIVGSHEFNPVVIFEKDSAVDGKYTTLEITGSLTIKSETAVLFGVWDKAYSIPEKDDCLIICSSVNEGGLKLLAPYAQRGDFDYTTNEYTGYTRPLEDHEFFAQSGSDGRVYIYLGEKTNGGEPDVPVQPDVPVLPDFTVKPGETLVLGGNGGQLPSVQNPVQMQGGVADASGLDESLLNNKVITGENGTLQTGHNQTMQLTGSDKIGYSVVGLAGNQHGADLEISSSSNLTLAGEKYDSARVKVQKGTVTISSKTTIGTGADGDVLDLTSKAVSATNFGTVAADVEIANESTLLNQGKVKGDVFLQGKYAAMVNNGSVDGLVTVGSGALLSGSGTAGALILESGATLNVGNSPGYQKYGSLTLNRGSAVSFTVDGVQSATLSNAGSGTHSVLTTDELTITPGTGSVTINVEVTMGIVNAGFEPVEVTLASAGEGNAIAADFAINLDDNELLEDGAEVTWDAATQSLILSGSVNKAALAVLMDSNSANVANTMWASANAVQEFARTAESQFLVGMPGQTTFWGAALGSFMDISGDAGFTSNMGGYAVGLQHAFTESFRAGFAFGQSFGSFTAEDDQLKADQTALMPALTAQYVTPLSKVSSLSISGHIAYGTVENEADTYQAGTAGKAEWDDKVLNIGLRATWNRQLTDNTTVSLFTGLTYQSVDQDSFTEKFDGGERDYRSGSLSSLSLPIGATWRGIYQMEGTNVFEPELTVAYIGDIARDNPEVKTSVMGITREGKGTNIGRSALMLNAGANWMFDSTWSVGAFYTLETRSHQLNQSVNAVLRCCF